jgi:hypothetical protein
MLRLDGNQHSLRQDQRAREKGTLATWPEQLRDEWREYVEWRQERGL